MLTTPAKNEDLTDVWKHAMTFMNVYDSHRWVQGLETGKGGYKHVQARVRVSMGAEEGFASLKEHFPNSHIEQCSDTWDYETKEGRYLSSGDYDDWNRRWIHDRISCRFGKERDYQQEWDRLLESSNDRDIVVFYDGKGCKGKSWWSIHNWEIGRAHVVNPSGTAKALMQDVASKYANQGYRPWLIIDIPRTWKWTDEIYYVLEKIKDGLISDPRYSATDINIRGVKVAVTCNEAPVKAKLSDDRWLVWDVQHGWFAPGFERRTLPYRNTNGRVLPPLGGRGRPQGRTSSAARSTSLNTFYAESPGSTYVYVFQSA